MLSSSEVSLRINKSYYEWFIWESIIVELVIWLLRLKLNVGFKSRNDCVVEESSLCCIFQMRLIKLWLIQIIHKWGWSMSHWVQLLAITKLLIVHQNHLIPFLERLLNLLHLKWGILLRQLAIIHQFLQWIARVKILEPTKVQIQFKNSQVK